MADQASGAGLEPPRPRIVAVIGASGGRATIGAEIAREIAAGGHADAVYAVNPHCIGHGAAGVPCVATLADLPGPPDLAVITVPGYAVTGVAAACGRAGAAAIAVVGQETVGVLRRELLEICRAFGMRLAGPEDVPGGAGAARSGTGGADPNGAGADRVRTPGGRLP